MLKISEPEYILMKKFIEDHCGIHLEGDKQYLIESRLYELVRDSGCNSFQQFHFKARTDYTGILRDKIIDAMTTNETMWFRDKHTWEYLEETAVPLLLEQSEATGKAQVWCAAASTGQEPYSLLMLLDEASRRRGKPELLDKIEILATDISWSALQSAKEGRYDAISINRGLPEEKKNKYFSQDVKHWIFDPKLKQRVKFKHFNLQNSFIFFPLFDLVLMRNVSIYFSDAFKRQLFAKTASVLRPGGILILGATESLREYSRDFDIVYHKNAVINIRHSVKQQLIK